MRTQKWKKYPHKKIVWLDAKKFPEVAKCNWCVRLEPKVAVRMSRSDIAALSISSEVRSVIRYIV